MPRRVSVYKEDIINAAITIVRENGYKALNARALAECLGCSTQPIFSNFSSMDDLSGQVLIRCLESYNSYVKAEFDRQQGFPPYKTYGMAYIRFAKEQKNLFKLLFMRDKTGEQTGVEDSTFLEVLPLIMKSMGLSEESATLFHLEMWTFVHGIGSMIASSSYDWDLDLASRTLTDAYQGLKHRFEQMKTEAENERH